MAIDLDRTLEVQTAARHVGGSTLPPPDPEKNVSKKSENPFALPAVPKSLRSFHSVFWNVPQPVQLQLKQVIDIADSTKRENGRVAIIGDRTALKSADVEQLFVDGDTKDAKSSHGELSRGMLPQLTLRASFAACKLAADS